MSGEGRGWVGVDYAGMPDILIEYHLFYVFQCVSVCVMSAYQHISSVRQAF